MKKTWMAAILCIMCILLTACSGQPAAVQDDVPIMLVDADASALPGSQGVYSLYFHLGNGPYLATEERQVTVEQDETLEMALVRQLIAGPSSSRTALNPLFPEGTEVIATSKQGDILFITLNEAFLTGYAAEKSGLSGEARKNAIRAERQLCLDSLTATLTEAGVCTQVQILIHRTQVQGNSLRLEEDYLLQNGSALPLAPSVRREESLYTPRNAAQHMLSLWMARDFDGLMSCICVQGRPGEQQVKEMLEGSPVLTGFVLSYGQPSADGTSAIVTADITFYKNESTWTISGFPFRMQRENGVWKIHFDTLQNLMTGE